MKNLSVILLVLSAFVIVSFSSCKKGLDGEIKALDSLKVGLIAYYPMNNTGADSSGNGYNAAIFNMNSAIDRFGIPNYAYYFDGVSSYMSVNDNVALRLNNTDFTLTGWVNLNSYNLNSGSFIFSKRTSGLNDGWGFSLTGYQSGLGVLGGVFLGPGGGNSYAVSTKGITLGKWYMVTAVYSLAKQQVSLYINGAFDSATSNIPTPNGAITANLYIGRDNPANNTSYFLNGALNDMCIYSRALSASQVHKLYLATKL